MTDEDNTFDLDAARARRREAAKNTVLYFTFGGEKFECVPADEWGFDVAENLVNGQITTAIRGILGENEYDRFAALKPSMGDINDLIEWLGNQATGSSGNSSRSAGSRSRTAKR